MWNSFVHLAARVLTWFWFAGAILMLLTIPACIFKIFSALWENGSEHEETVSDRPPAR